MATGTATVRVRAVDGTWETLGVDRLRGIVPEGVEATANEWGPDQLSFQIKAQFGAQRPDLLPFTPVELEVDGTLVWAGRVRERPSDDANHAVSCQGWQYQLDDDLFDRVYVHTRVGDYVDSRTLLAQNLALFTVSGTIANDSGTIQIGWPNGAIVPNGAQVGVTLDLGPDSTAKRVVLDWDSSNNSAGTSLYVRASDSPDANAAGVSDDAFNFAMNTGASGTTAGTFATARRYVHVFLFRAVGVTYASDTWARIKAIKIFRSTAYESGNASILKADSVVADALAKAPLLESDLTLVSAGTFNIPSYVTGGYSTPRSVVEAVNAYENYRAKIGGTTLRQLVYGPKPTTPIVEFGEWSDGQFDDASISGDDIYDRAIVDATGPDGGRIVSVRESLATLYDKNAGGTTARRTALLSVNSAVTQAVADRFGDLWLSEHAVSPFAGTLTVTGPGIRRLLGGASVPAHDLLLYGGEKLRFSNRIDPDTGGFGRDGRIAGVRYNHDAKAATISIDDQRDNFARTLARYGVLVGEIA